MRLVSLFGLGFIALSGALPVSAIAQGEAVPLKVIIVDQQAVMRDSLAGQDIARQGGALRDAITKEIEAERDDILADEKSLVDNARMYSPTQREQMSQEIEQRKRQFPEFQQREAQILEFSMQRASNQIGAAVRPIIQQLIEEKKASLVIDKTQVIFVDDSYDVTDEVISRLNNVLTAVKVERVNLEDLANQARAAQQQGQQTAAPAPPTGN